MIWLGGDMFYEKFYGKLKDVKLYFDNVITEGTRMCSTDENCADCSPNGECLKCKSSFKVVNGKCMCATVTNCLLCKDTKTCTECDRGF